jgi:GntR family transcriptional regulator
LWQPRRRTQISRFGLAVKAIRPGKAVAGMTDGGSRQVDSDIAGCNSCPMTIDKGTSPAGGRAGASPPGAGGGDGPAAAARGPSSPIEFRLDPASGVPTYLQLVHQVEHALRLGYLKPGDQLPRVRDAVASLAINPNTVLKAYKELETKGLAAGRPGQGTFIQATLSQVALPELTVLHRSLLGWLATADAAGLDEDGIVALFTSALRDFRDRRGGSGDRRGAARRDRKGVA